MVAKGSGRAAGGEVRTFRLAGTGLERVLGELEASIMDSLWRQPEASVQEVCDALGPQHNYKTVMTVMNRLVAKGLLLRRRLSKAFLYSPSESRQSFLDGVSRKVAAGLVQDFGATAIAQFVDAVDELAPEELRALEELVRRKVESESEKGGL